MTDTAPFTFNPQSTLLTPGASGIEVLLDCLQSGATIFARQSPTHPIARQADIRQVLLCETSGTSGTPKVIRRKPQSWIASFDVNKQRFALSSNDTYATFGSLGHSLTLYATLEALHIGADLCTVQDMPPRRQAQILTESGATILYATPSQLRLLHAGAQAARIPDLPHVRQVFAGGGKLDPELRTTLNLLFPSARLHEFFGASETSFITMADDQTPHDAVGRAYPGVALRIGPGPKCLVGETGEIWVSSPYLFERYEAGASTETRWQGAFLSIGEMGSLDANGNLFLRGRKNRMVTVADNNVFAEEIERVVTQISGVDTCAIVAMPDLARGNRLVCFVQSTSAVSDAELRRYCRAKLGAHSVPKEFVFVQDMPLLPAGKPDLQKLRISLGKRA